MTFRTKRAGCIAAALCLGAGSSAQAIDIDNADLGIATGNGSGELFFSLWDPARSQSFLLDLDIPVSDFVGDNASIFGTTVTSSALADFIAGGNVADMAWNVGGVSNVPNAAAFYTVSSIDPDSVYVAPPSPNVQGAVSSAGQYVGSANPGLTDDPSGDFGVFGLDDGLAYFGAGAWGFGWGGNYAFDNAPEIGETASTWLSSVAGENTEFDGGFWDLDATTGTVSYNVIPVPAAAWLFASALGLLGAARRRRA